MTRAWRSRLTDLAGELFEEVGDGVCEIGAFKSDRRKLMSTPAGYIFSPLRRRLLHPCREGAAVAERLRPRQDHALDVSIKLSLEWLGYALVSHADCLQAQPSLAARAKSSCPDEREAVKHR